MAVTQAQLNELYLAYFGRPVDYNGYVFYTSNAASTVATVGAAFSASAESQALYGVLSNTGNAASFVNAIYRNLFNRDAEVAGLTYWSTQIAKGVIAPADVALVIMKAAVGTDATSVTNKLAVSQSFFDQLDTTPELLGYAGTAAAASARAFIATVSDTAASVTAANAVLASTVASITGQGGVVGQTFTLTNGVDTGAAFTGGSGNDVFNAAPTIVIDPATGAQNMVDSLQSADVLTGGAGADRLNVTFATATAAKPTLSGVETVVATFNAAGGKLDLGAASGVTTVVVDKSSAAGSVVAVGDAALSVSNTNSNVAFDGSTATALSLTANTVGKSSALVTVDAGAVTASKATSETVTVTNAHIDLNDAVNNVGILTATINASGKNTVKFTDAAGTLTSLTVTGSGSVDVSKAALTKVATVTAGDGGLKLDATGNTATTLKITTGAGVDTLTITGANAGAISTGGGNDKVTTTTAFAATSTVDLGDGNDTLTLGAVGAGVGTGETLTGGAGTDTIAMKAADYVTVTGYSAANLAKITGFEVLGISNALTTATYDVSKIAGVGSFTAFAGVTAANVATLTNLGANAVVTLAGDLTVATGSVVATIKTDTSADVLNLVLKSDYTDNNDTTVDNTAVGVTVTASGIENLNVNSTGNQLADLTTLITGYKADTVTNTLTLTDDALATLTVTGDQILAFTSAATQVKLATIDASANTGGLTFSGAAADMATPTTSAAMTITGSATAANNLTGSGHDDTIVGGAGKDTIVGGAGKDTINGGSGADTITGGTGADAMTGGAGNDVFKYATVSDSTLINLDTISDFSANTFGQGASGAANSSGATETAADRTGDVIDLSALAVNSNTVAGMQIAVSVQANASDAQTFLQNTGALGGTAAGFDVAAALDSSSGRLYIDVDHNGTADMVIALTGVTTITAAAFDLTV